MSTPTEASGGGPGPWAAAIWSHPTARACIRQWRRLTGGRTVRDSARRTLVACSGGADSTALLLALGAAAREHIVAAHIRHDLRPEPQTLEDQRAVEALAVRLGVPVVTGRVLVRDRAGNTESNARRARYRALARLARQTGCGVVATAHQADDQLETMLMRLVRGAGPAGLAGMAPSRSLGDAAGGLVLVRPMLVVGRAQAESLCREAGVGWREDPTNSDASRWRARIRRDVAPVLRTLRPGVERRAAAAAASLREAADVVRERATSLRALARAGPRGGLTWDRGMLAGQTAIVLGELLRIVRKEWSGDRQADRLASRSVLAITRGLRDPDRRSRRWAVAGIIVEADSRCVLARPATGDDATSGEGRKYAR